jgi:hypothetical protein
VLTEVSKEITTPTFKAEITLLMKAADSFEMVVTT